MCVGSLMNRSASNSPDHFTCRRLNKSTFMVVADDKYFEEPQIFVKVYPSTVVLIDTGCGMNPKDPDAEPKSLRVFLETYSVADNNNAPLNPGGEKPYTLILTHCHYDHIGGIPEFTTSSDTRVWASGLDKCFYSPSVLRVTSLCYKVGMETPKYKVTNWIKDGDQITDSKGIDLKLTAYHAPGHTPDQIAIWDPEERSVYVGDTLYTDAPIFLYIGGSAIAYSDTIGRLRKLVDTWNKEVDPGTRQALTPATLHAGHITSGVDAGQLLADVDDVLYQISQRQIEPVDEGEMLNDKVVRYTTDDGRLGFTGYEIVFEEFIGEKSSIAALSERRAKAGEKYI